MERQISVGSKLTKRRNEETRRERPFQIILTRLERNARDLAAPHLFACGVTLVSWDQEFFDPIVLPGRAPLLTLRDAAHYITKLPKSAHETQEWQAAMEALILVASSGGPTMFARIGVMQALNRHVERVINPDRKDHHWGRRKLARDQ